MIETQTRRTAEVMARKRSTDFTIGKQLGARDHLATWIRPQRPDWMSTEEYEHIPATLTVREFYAGYVSNHEHASADPRTIRC